MTRVAGACAAGWAGVRLLGGCSRTAMAPSARYTVWGQRGRRHGSFVRPRAINVRGDEVYVVDTTGRVQVLDAEGNFVRSWSTPAHENGTPTGLAFDRRGNVLIPDTHYSQILEYTRDGELVEKWGSYGVGEDQFIYPTDIAQTADGAYYVSEYGMDAERVHVFDSSRRFMRQWGRHGDAEGQFNRAMAIAVDEQGTVYVVDTANHRVQCFDSNGTFLRVIGQPGVNPGHLNYPHDIALAPGRSMFVCEYGTHRISQFTRGGTFVACYGRPGRAPGEFNAPRGIAASEAGVLFVADTDNHRVQRIEGGFKEAAALAGVARDADGDQQP